MLVDHLIVGMLLGHAGTSSSRPQRQKVIEAIVGQFEARMANLMAPNAPVVQVSTDGRLGLL